MKLSQHTFCGEKNNKIIKLRLFSCFVLVPFLREEQKTIAFRQLVRGAGNVTDNVRLRSQLRVESRKLMAAKLFALMD